jgi:hypothetical protein
MPNINVVQSWWNLKFKKYARIQNLKPLTLKQKIWATSMFQEGLEDTVVFLFKHVQFKEVLLFPKWKNRSNNVWI